MSGSSEGSSGEMPGGPAEESVADGEQELRPAPASRAPDRTRELGDVLELTLGAPVRYSRGEVAAAARMTVDEVGRLWRAMGFPDVGSAQALTDADLAALLRMSGLLERGLLDIDSLIDIVRSLGQTTSRLAEWQIETVGRQRLRQLEERAEDDQPAWSGLDRAALVELLPELDELLIYVWRRQLTASIGRVLDDIDEAEIVPDTATVGFADLVSFTRLSRQLDQESLSMLVHTFETAAADVVYAVGGRLVKTLGDEVMFSADSASIAAEIGLRLHELSRGDPDLPQMRVGLATGGVLMRMGDVFGTTVNRASRLTAVAKPGTTLLDSATADALAAGQDGRFGVRAQTPRPIRGLGIVRPYALTRGSRRLDEVEHAVDTGSAVPAAASQAEEPAGATAVSSEPTSGDSGKT